MSDDKINELKEEKLEVVNGGLESDYTQNYDLKPEDFVKNEGVMAVKHIVINRK